MHFFQKIIELSHIHILYTHIRHREWFYEKLSIHIHFIFVFILAINYL